MPYKQNMQVRDVVIRRDEMAAGQTHKYTHVIEVHNGTDKMVRSADIEYKLPREEQLQLTMRPIYKLMTVVPMEELASIMN
jgi:hypothetical protein